MTAQKVLLTRQLGEMKAISERMLNGHHVECNGIFYRVDWQGDWLTINETLAKIIN